MKRIFSVTAFLAVLSMLAFLPANPAFANDDPFSGVGLPPEDLEEGGEDSASTEGLFSDTHTGLCESYTCTDAGGESVDLDSFTGGVVCWETGGGYGICDQGEGDLIPVCMDAAGGFLGAGGGASLGGGGACEDPTADPGDPDPEPGTTGTGCVANYDDVLDAEGEVIGTVFTGWSYPAGTSTSWTEGPGWFFRFGQEYWGTRTSHYGCSATGNITLTHYTYGVVCYFTTCVASTINPAVGEAQDFLDNFETNVLFNPDSAVVNIDTWVWDAAAWQQRMFFRAHPQAPVTAQVRLRPEMLVVDMGDDNIIGCEDGGTPWSPGGTTDCDHEYRRPSLHTPGNDLYDIISFRQYATQCSVTTGGASSAPALPAFCGAALQNTQETDRTLEVLEIQARNE